MTRRAPLVLCGALTVAAVLVLPALAQGGAGAWSISVSTPAEGTTLTSSAVDVDGTASYTWRPSTGNPQPPGTVFIESVSMTPAFVGSAALPKGCDVPATEQRVRQPPSPSTTTPNTTTPSTTTPSTTTPPAEYSDNMDFSFDPFFECNGRYEVTIVARASNELPNSVGTTIRTFGVAEPPAGIADVVASVNSDGTVSVRWTALAPVSPDLLGYRVERAIASGGFTPIADVNGLDVTSFKDTEITGGAGTAARRGPEPPTTKVTYRVRGRRVGPDGNVLGPAGEAPSIRVEGVVDPDDPGGRAGGEPGGTDGVDPTAPGSAAPGSAGSGRRRPVDTGFELSLPLPDNGRFQDLPEGDQNAVRALLDDAGTSDRKNVLGPIAGGLILLVGALQMRFLTSQASRPLPVIEPTFVDDPASTAYFDDEVGTVTFV